MIEIKMIISVLEAQLKIFLKVEYFRAGITGLYNKHRVTFVIVANEL